MLHHAAFLVLADPAYFSAEKCQRAIRLFAEFDLSVPRHLVAEELDRRFAWPIGAAQRTLNSLQDAGILQSLSRGRLSAGGSSMMMLAPEYTFTPRSLQQQWEQLEASRDRASVSRAGPDELHPLH